MVIMTGKHHDLMNERFLLKIFHENVPGLIYNSITDCGSIINTNIGYIVFDQVFEGEYKVVLIREILKLMKKHLVESTISLVNTSGSTNEEKYEILKNYIKYMS